VRLKRVAHTARHWPAGRACRSVRPIRVTDSVQLRFLTLATVARLIRVPNQTSPRSRPSLSCGSSAVSVFLRRPPTLSPLALHWIQPLWNHVWRNACENVKNGPEAKNHSKPIFQYIKQVDTGRLACLLYE
jgi:hypothetical protein